MRSSAVHLCGSVPLSDAESVFRVTAERLGGLIRRIPDGETGERGNWVVWQLPLLKAHPDLEAVPPPTDEYGPATRVRVRSGVDPEKVTLHSLGYARSAIESWGVFARLQAAGVIPEDVRFQVSLPTPIAVVAAFVAEHQAELERAYETRLLAELAEILAVVPGDRLAVQWDTAVEFAVFEGVFPAWFGSDYDAQRGPVIDRLTRLGNAVPPDVELGYHLCYGDYGHKHFVEPPDTSKLTTVANEVSAGLDRSLEWVHMPVPRDRDDVAYFAPLRELRLQHGTGLYLGLVHATDGIDGARRRLTQAAKVVPNFGIATECGFGRRPAEQVPELLDLHATLAREAITS